MIITLLTDLGTRDAAVAIAKAELQRLLPDAELVDISHQVARHNWREAAYLLSSVYRDFPPATIHCAPVSVFGERQPRMVLTEKDGHYFIAPDNGLLASALGNDAMINARMVHQFAKPYDLVLWFTEAGNIIQQISGGAAMPGLAFEANMPPLLPAPQVTPINIVCRILYADRYKNLVVNINRDEFEAGVNGRPFRIRTFNGVNINSVSKHYNEVPVGASLCRFNKNGYLEIAVNHGSAMELFGIDPEDPTALDFHSVRISF
jgi:S-adenosyl-L-methionine hydrolase (adenosine-forming)